MGEQQVVKSGLARAAGIPKLAKNTRLPDADRQRVGQVLLTEYKKGKSIRELCRDTGYSIGRVRGLLTDVGVEFRPRGGARHTRRRSQNRAP